VPVLDPARVSSILALGFESIVPHSAGGGVWEACVLLLGSGAGGLSGFVAGVANAFADMATGLRVGGGSVCVAVSGMVFTGGTGKSGLGVPCRENIGRNFRHIGLSMRTRHEPADDLVRSIST
jgi:hypothetical protein